MDEQSKNLDNLDMLDFAMSISVGGMTRCLPETWRGNSERHSDAKLYYPVDGRGWVEIGGHTTRLQAGALYLVPPQVESSYGTEKGITISWIHFQPHSPTLYWRFMGIPHAHRFSKAMAEKWAPTCLRLSHFLETGDEAEAFRIHAMLLDCAGAILPTLSEKAPVQRLNYERLLPALQTLNGPLTEKISLGDLARKVGLSPEHFHRLFHGVFLTTPLRYRMTRQMAAARRMLAEGRWTVTEVAAQCGFDDPFYFSRVFRRFYGTAPSSVRRGGWKP